MKLLRLWLLQIRYAATRELMFRASFFVWMAVELAWFVIQLAFLGVLYQHVDEVAGWNRNQMIILVTTNQLVIQIFTAFLMPGLSKLPELVRTGKLDFVLLKPVPPAFLVSTSHLEIGPLANGAIAVVILTGATHALGLHPTALQLFAYLGLVLAGLLVHYAVLMSLVSLTFWIIRAESVLLGYYTMFHVARIPREAATGWFRAVFTFALPLLLVANVPAAALIRGLDPQAILDFLLASLAVALLATLWFRFGLRRYQSASS